MSEIQSYKAQLVRFEEDEALIVVDLGNRETLMLVDAKPLQDANITEENQSFTFKGTSTCPGTLPQSPTDFEASAETAAPKAKTKQAEKPWPRNKRWPSIH